MKFLKKKTLIPIIATAAIISPISMVLSCSKSTSNDYSVSSNESLYSDIWNLSLITSPETGEGIIPNSFFDMTVSQLEEQINKNIKSDSKNNFILKIYSFYLLWNAIKNPRDTAGTVVNSVSSEMTDFSTFLSNKLSQDDSSVTLTSKKTYNNFKKYINTFDYKISIVNFDNGSINNNLKLREVFDRNQQYILNFQFNFWTSDNDTNAKMVSNGKSIMMKTALTRDQRQTLQNIKNSEVKELTKNQFTYQGTQLYYDVDAKKFISIILPSNIYSGLTDEATPDSGFATSDKNRQLFQFNWYSRSENSTTFDSYINLLLDVTTNFSTNFTSDWTNFLNKESILVDGKMQMMKINLDRPIKYNANEYED